MKALPYSVPERSRIRVIISTDAKNEADDQYAIAYALMSPKLDVVGIIGAHFYEACSMEASAHYGTPPELTMEKSYEEVKLVLDKMGLTDKVPALRGSALPLKDEKTPQDSEGAHFIIEEAHKPGAPLYVINLGTITDLASAYLMDPTISEGIEACLWLGGGRFPEGGAEFNLENDIAAGNVLMDSTLNVHLLPLNSTAPIKMTFAEMFCRVYPYGEIGRYLVEQTIDFSSRCPHPLGESWIMWDIAAVALLLDPHPQQYFECNAPRFNVPDMTYITCERVHPIRVYERIEPRFALEDFYCKLQLCFDRNAD